MAEDKKLIIDEDWKSQVQAEKEAANRAAETSSASLAGGADAASSGSDEDYEMPPASLEMLVSTLATEAMIAMGQIPHPATGKPELRPNQAKYLIDTIAVLGEKTKGNITPQEEEAFSSLLHQLRMAYVAATPAARPRAT
jgi:hypothetical protein